MPKKELHLEFELTVDYKTILSKLDWFVFFGVLLLTFIYGQYLKKKKGNISDNNEIHFLDLFLMGRQLTLPMFVATLVATWYGGIFGVTKIANIKLLHSLT